MKNIYIRLPKTASTSISNLLIKNGYSYVSKSDQTYDKLVIEPLRLFRSKIINKNFFVNGLQKEYDKTIDLKDYHTFTIIRSPYTKLVSSWKYLMTHDKIVSELLKQEGKMTFKDYVLYLNSNYDKLSVRDRWHIEPLSNLLYSENDDFIDTIIKFENIHPDFDTLCKKLDIHGKLSHINSSKINNYMEYYDKYTLEITNQIYQNDFKKFNYEYYEI